MIERMIKNITGLIETQIELVKLEAKEEIASAAAKLVYAVLVIMAASVFLIAFALGIAMLLNDWLESRYWGFFIIATIFGVVIGILLYFRKDSRLLDYFKKHTSELLSQKQESEE